MAVKLIDRDGSLYTSTKDIVDDICRKHYGGDEFAILLCFFDQDVNSIAWPNPDLRELRSALYDARETGMIPFVQSVELPDGSELEF